MNKDIKKNLFSTLTVASFLLTAAPVFAAQVSSQDQKSNLQNTSNIPQQTQLAQGAEGTCCCACK